MLVLAEENLLPVLTKLFKAAAERQPYVHTLKVYVISTRDWCALRTYPQTLEVNYTARDLGVEKNAYGLDELWRQLYRDSERYEMQSHGDGEGNFEFSLDVN